jgi:hypothetical protein
MWCSPTGLKSACSGYGIATTDCEPFDHHIYRASDENIRAATRSMGLHHIYRPARSQSSARLDVFRKPILVMRVSRDSRLASYDPGATAGQGVVSGGPVHQISLDHRFWSLPCMSGRYSELACQERTAIQRQQITRKARTRIGLINSFNSSSTVFSLLRGTPLACAKTH